MKKSLLALSLTTLVFASCKKDIDQKSITTNETVGTGYVKGNLTKTIITPAGPNNWNNNTTVGAAGVNIAVRVAKNGANGLYPNSSIQGTDVYTGTTDANGNFNIAVKSNGRNGGVSADVMVEGWQATMDTVVNGVTKTGRLSNYFGAEQTVQVYVGQSTFVNFNTWSMGNGNVTIVNDVNNPGTINQGTATITGSVNISHVRQMVTVVSGTPGAPVISNTQVPAPAGTKVYCTFNSDPTTFSTKVYQTTLDANAGYSFNIATVAMGTPGFNQNATVWVADFAATRDTVKVTTTMTGTVFVSSTTVVATGIPGIWNTSGTQNPINGLYNGELRNGGQGGNFSFAAGSFSGN